MKKRITFIILIIFIILGISASLSALSLKKAISASKKALDAIKIQDLDGAKIHLVAAKKDFQTAQKTLVVLTPLRVIPLIGWYVADAQRGVSAAASGLDAATTAAAAITPYADVLGLKGEGTFLGGTAQERLAKAIEAISKIGPQMDSVGASLAKTRKDVDAIQSWRYPNFLPGRPGAKIDNIKKAVDQVESLIVDSRPLLLVLPQIMGQDKESKYLVLFQNDKELRPTGGFITAYAHFRVNRGIIASEGSDDIYRLDNTLLKRIPAPPPIIKYLPGVSTFNLRDTNLSPDYTTSIKLFEDLYQATAGAKDIDGIIALDTQFVLSLMEVLGPVDAYGTKFTIDTVEECACPQIIYELERYADQPVAYEKGSRKDIIGVLMQSLMTKTFNAPKGQWPNLLEAVVNNLREKHLLLYFHDPKVQEAVEKINFAGRIYQYDGDYLHINEANFGGAKSNLYIQEKVSQVIKKGKDGNLDKTITINYKYPRQMDNCSLERKSGLCLAGIYRDYIRVYVPKGSKLTSSAGAEVAFTQSEDLGKTVFEGFFTVRPEGTAKIELAYTVPLKVEKTYKLLIQKQPGTDGIMYDIDAFGHKQKAFPLATDKELIVKL
ncbi:DUF4012 domain-containing protein [Candidatus Curtissbacteria bacterium]|nr:DUF4012 domain-containing protein [Candidatus Curtissbacteria bacterium]